jgi:ribosomal-protein-alanine N-acetyltransferase
MIKLRVLAVQAREDQMLKYTGERLYFKEYSKAEFGLFYSVFSNEQVMRYALIDKYESEEAIRPFFNEVLEHNTAPVNRRDFEFAVFLQADDSFIGFGDIKIHNKNSMGGCGEIGYFLLPIYWGQGYATETAKMLVEIGFKHLGLHRVSARCNANNLNSENVMKKAGMTKEGEAIKVRFKNCRWVNEKQYGILIEEWEKSEECGKESPRAKS